MLSLYLLLSCGEPAERRPPLIVTKNVVLDGIVQSEMYISAYKDEPSLYSFEVSDPLHGSYKIRVQPSWFVTRDAIAEMIEPGCRVMLGPLTLSSHQRVYDIEAHQIAVFELPKQPPVSSKTLNTVTDSVVANGRE